MESKEENIFICKICNKSFKTVESLKRHMRKLHEMSKEDFYVDFYLNGVYPTCKCGCGERTTYNNHGFAEWKQGHVATIKCPFLTQESKDKSAKTRKQLWKEGKIEPWNKGMKGEEYIKHFEDENGYNKMNDVLTNPERCKKISDKLTGRIRTEEHQSKITKGIQEYWGKQESRDKQREALVNYHKTRFNNKISGLELTFIEMLQNNNLDFEFQVNVGNYLYDFLIKDTKLLIEVDGDFYHYNPLTNDNNKKLYDIQKHTMEHDIVKNQIAKDYNYHLLRFWEYDIKKDPEKVIKTLLDKIEELKNL
jgi:very-short-patch-repair endonuclease